MELEITIHSDHKYLEIVTRGVLDKESSMEMVIVISKTMRRHRLKRH